MYAGHMSEQEAREALDVLYGFSKRQYPKRKWVDAHMDKILAESGGAWSGYYAKHYLLMLESKVKIG